MSHKRLGIKRKRTNASITSTVDFYVAMSQTNDHKRFWGSTGCKKLRQMCYEQQRALSKENDACS